MESKITRKGFLAKGLAAAVTAVGAATGISYIFKNNSERKNTMAASPILDIRPLGFQWETADPFLFCVHHHDFYPKGNEIMGPAPELLQGRDIGQDFTVKDADPRSGNAWRMYHGAKVPGFPNHPHRGFETVTVVRKGFIDHSDSLGAAGRYGSGDVQWMTAGAGVQHAEMFPLIESNKENTLELFQIWLNLPKKNKFVNPHFKMLWNKDIPKLALKDSAGRTTRLEVIAGRYGDTAAAAPPPDSWAAESANNVSIWHIDLEAHAEFTLPAAATKTNRFLYFYAGDQISAAGTAIGVSHGLRLDSAAGVPLKAGAQAAQLLLLEGKPIAEPVVQYGPFVMNTRAEIEQAFADYQRTHFGGWPWQTSEPVHERGRGRFARHADGHEETASG